jgi:V/A-type H+-transporting ATPase subunit D
MPDREATPTHSAFLELKEERAGMREGYGFLDEKRLILASEILEQLGRYEEEMNGFRREYAAAVAALRAAVGRHGLEGLLLYPPAPEPVGELKIIGRSVLGVIVQELGPVRAESGTVPPAVDQSPEAEHCREAFRALVPRAAALATLAGNLERLRLEYRRTARRARALEDVLLPEIDGRIKTVETALEELDREEAIRVRILDRTDRS